MFDFRLCGFVRAPSELNRHFPAGTSQLSVIKKAHTRQTKEQESSGALFVGRKNGGDSGLIMILEEMSAVSDQFRWALEQVALDARRFATDEAVVEGFVISVIKT